MNIQVKFENNLSVICDIAVTDVERAVGLKAKDKLPHGHGLLFYYEEESAPLLFCNRDVKFDIEVLYIGANLQITSIDFLKKDSTEISICSKPTKYVLEVPAGTCKDYGIKVGTSIVDFSTL